MLANNVYGPIAAKTLTGLDLGSGVSSRYYYNYLAGIVSNYRFKFNEDELNLLRICNESVKSLLFPNIEKETDNYNYSYIISSLYEKHLKYCPICLEKGFHSFLHQVVFLEKCIYHNVKLEKKCKHCGKDIEFVIFFNNNLRAYSCLNCYKPLVDIKFENLIGEWDSEKRINHNFKPFNINNSIYLITIKNNKISDPIILKTLHELFLSKNKTNNPIYSSNSSFKTNWSNYYKNEVFFDEYLCIDNPLINRAYYIALRFCSRHIKVQKYITLRKIYIFEDIFLHFYSMYRMRGENYAKNRIVNKFDIEIFTYYIWKRDIECRNRSYNEYNINTPNYRKYYGMNLNISNSLNNLELYLVSKIKNKNFILDILIHAAIILFEEKYKYTKKILEDYYLSHGDLDLYLNVDQLMSVDTFNKEILILINDNKYELYYDNSRPVN